MFIILPPPPPPKKNNNHSDHLSENRSSLNKILRDLHLFPINSVRFQLSQFENKKAIVFFMREKDCPISEKYGPRMVRIEDKYSKKGVQFIYVYVGQLKPKKSAKEDLKKFDFKSPYLIDSKQTVIDALSARTTGDVFILNPERRVIYRGPLDDQFHLLKSALRPKNNYVSDMLDAMTSGKKITPKELPAPGCVISRPIIKKKVFFKDVLPIIQKKCVNCHHPKGDAPIDLSSYEKIASRHAMIKYTIENNLMPPWPVDPNTGPWKYDLSLTVYEKALLMKWLATGLKKGSFFERRSKIRKNRQIKHVDYSFELPFFEVPAEGYFSIKEFKASTSFKEDKWIKEIQFITTPKIMHHFAFAINPLDVDSSVEIEERLGNCLVPKGKKKSKICIKFGLFWTVGDRKYYNFQDAGFKLPKGREININIHYESIGQKMIDNQSEIRFSFHKNTPKYQILSLGTGSHVKIPPETYNYKSEVSYKTKANLTLMGVRTHMHLRGLASAIFAIDPKGNSNKIFGSEWNFNFQRIFFFKNFFVMPKNAILRCVNWFDNSSKNVINPDPKKTVVWGIKTSDEMSLCNYLVILPTSKDPFSILQ